MLNMGRKTAEGTASTTTAYFLGVTGILNLDKYSEQDNRIDFGSCVNAPLIFKCEIVLIWNYLFIFLHEMFLIEKKKAEFYLLIGFEE